MDLYVAGPASTWKKATGIFVASGGVWKKVTSGWVASGGVWKKFFSSAISPTIDSTVTISRNNAAYPSTLTGTNYHWNNSTSLTYVFQKSSDNASWSNIGSATSISNPSSGSSNTVTYILTTSDFSASPMYYRFVVTAVNSTYSTSTVSTSTSVTVTYTAPSGGTASISTDTGTYAVGSVITYSTSGWTGSPTSYDLRLYNGTSPVLTSDSLRASTTSASGTYTIASGDVGNYFKVYVTATNVGGTSTEVGSTQVGPATLAVSKPTGGIVTLTPSGNQYAGTTLTASTSGWTNTPTSYSVRIYANTTNPPTTANLLKVSSTSSSVTYIITDSDAAAPAFYFKAFASATNAGGTSTDAESNVVLSVAKTAPDIVTSFTATSSLAGTTLSWNATWSAPSSDGGAAITSYKVYVERGSSSSGPWTASTTSISTTSGGTYSGAYTAASPYSTVNATTPKTIYGRVTGTAATWIRVYVAAVNSVGTGSFTTAVG